MEDTTRRQKIIDDILNLKYGKGQHEEKRKLLEKQPTEVLAEMLWVIMPEDQEQEFSPQHDAFEKRSKQFFEELKRINRLNLADGQRNDNPSLETTQEHYYLTVTANLDLMDYSVIYTSRTRFCGIEIIPTGSLRNISESKVMEVIDLFR